MENLLRLNDARMEVDLIFVNKKKLICIIKSKE